MVPELRRIGAGRHPVVVVDGVAGDWRAVVDAAAALAPFPPAHGTHYPGRRRIVTEADASANDYVERTLDALAPFIGGGFDADGFDLLEASFSIVTTPPEALAPAQRAPHFDSTDPDYLAVLHFLSDLPGTGTGFYRQRSTGIEMVEEGSLARFVDVARRESAALSGYANASGPAFQQLAIVEARPDRAIIYQGALLHSGLIPPGMVLDGDPRAGRLTANFFVRANRA